MKERLFIGDRPDFNGVEKQARIVCNGYLTIAAKIEDRRERFISFNSEKSENNSFSFK